MKSQKKAIEVAYNKLTPVQQAKVDTQTQACFDASKAYGKAMAASGRAFTAQWNAFKKLTRLYKGHLPADFFIS